MACKERMHSTIDACDENEVQISAVGHGAQHKRKESHKVSEEFILDTLNQLRAVLLSSKDGLTPKQILYDYIYLVGEPLPYLQMGHPDLVAFLDSHQNVCERFIQNGHMLYRPVLDERCEHIRRLVEGQKSETRKPRPRKRKSISINEENAAAPKRSKSDPRKIVCPTSEANDEEAFPIDSAPGFHVKNTNPSTPIDNNKSVHFEDLIFNNNNHNNNHNNNVKPQRQRSRTRLPFIHKDDPNKPKFRGFRRRGKSTSSVPVATSSEVRGVKVGNGKAVEMVGKNSGSLDVVSSSNSKRRVTRLGNPEMVTSTPRRSTSDIPLPDDIRRNLLTTLQDFPQGLLVHEIPASFKTKTKKDLPDFLSSSKALTEFFSCLTADVRVIRQALGSVRIKLLEFDAVPSTVDIPTTTVGCSSQSAKSRVVETLLRILSRYARGIFLSRLRVEYKKLTGELIPYRRLGFVSDRLFFASMPENFTLRTMTSDPGIEAEYIVSAVVLTKPSSSAVVPPQPPSSAVLSECASESLLDPTSQRSS